MNRAVKAFQDSMQQILYNLGSSKTELEVKPLISTDFEGSDFIARMSLLADEDEKSRGWLFALVEQRVAKNLVETMLAFPDRGVNDEDIKDGLGEFINVVAGGAKARLKGSPFHFMLSIPHCKRLDEERDQSCPIVGAVMIRANTDFGIIHILFALQAW